MKLAPIDNPLGEEILGGRCDSGLSVFLRRTPGRASTFGAFGTNFGSIDRVDGPGGAPVPEGLAHFLEHKLFEDAEGDVSDRFAALGASTNAMTGFCGTTYIASTIERPRAVLELLLDFVQHPHFTDELVEKEQGIIAQEIGLYDDDPDWRVFFGLLEGLFEQHPVRDNIAGSVDSIRRIDAATLRRCYDLFYHPNNMAFVVCGDVSPEEIAELVDADQGPRGVDARAAHRRGAVAEPLGAVRARTELVLPVARPRLLLGIKETELGGDPETRGRRQLLTQVALDLLFGRASPGYRDLYEAGLVDESFGVSHAAEESFGFSTLGGETDDPDRLEAALRERLARARAGELDTSALARIRARMQGALLKGSDSSERVGYAVLSAHFRQLPPFAALRWIRELSAEDLHERLRAHLDEAAMSVCVVRPQAS